MARIGQALGGFDHPAAHRQHVWDLTRIEQHKDKVSLLKDREKQSLLNWGFAQFTNYASPFFPKLPWQFIHGDANPENIRVRNDRIIGMLDFGDSCYNPLVCDLAICLTYQMMDQADPWSAGEQVIHAYESVHPLSEIEHAVLLPLVCGRLVVSLCIATERWHIDATNENWFGHEDSTWRLLAKIKSSEKDRISA